jgi:internalin A
MTRPVNVSSRRAHELMPVHEWPHYRPAKPVWTSPDRRSIDGAAFELFVAALVRNGLTAFEVVGCRGIPPAAFAALRGHGWTAVNIADTNGDDEALSALAESSSLTLSWLAASHSRVSSTGVALLSSIKTLVNLGVSDCELVDDTVLPSLVKFGSLRSLGLNRTNVSAVIAPCLLQFGKLAVLGVGGIDLSACNAADIRMPMSLRALDASLCGLTDRHLSAIMRIPIEELFIGGNAISDEGTRIIARLPLVALDISNSGITDAGVKGLAAMPSLRRLSIEGCQVSDEVIDALVASPALELVDLRGTAITTATIRLRRPALQVVD